MGSLDHDAAEMVRIWEAQIAHYVGVKECFHDRLAELDKEIAVWTKRRRQLIADHEQADSVISSLRSKIADTHRRKREAELLSQKRSGSPRRYTETTLAKARRLSLELERLRKELADNGIDEFGVSIPRTEQ